MTTTTLGHIDEITLSLASEITKLHNSIQLRSYMNYYDPYQVILTTILSVMTSEYIQL